MAREKIGFKREGELTPSNMREDNGESRPVVCVDRADVDNTIITVVRGYMEDRSKKCYKEGLDKDFMEKINKIFTKYYETIA